MNVAEGDESRDRLVNLTHASFFLLVFSLGFIQLPVTILGQNAVWTDFVFLLAGGLWLLSLVTRRLKFQWNSFYWLLSLYFVVLIISSAFSADRKLSFFRLLAEVYLIALCVLTFNLVQTPRLLKQVVIAWLLGTGFAVVLGLSTVAAFYIYPESSLLEFLTYHYGAVPVGNYPRITATFASASMFCNYLNVGLVMAFFSRLENWIKASTASLLVSGIVICSIFTISIGLGGVFLAFGVSYWLWTNSRQSIRSTMAFIGGVVAAIAFLVLSPFALAPYLGANVAFTIPFTQISVLPSSRALVWSEALGTFGENFITGRGLGLPVANVIFVNSEGSRSLLTDAHNTFLSVAAQDGIGGLLAIVLIAGFIIRRWIVRVRNGRTAFVTTGLGLAFLCSFIYQGLMGSFEEARHLWVLVGIFLAAERIEAKTN
jgi:O-antigen ligase